MQKEGHTPPQELILFFKLNAQGFVKFELMLAI
jgi:hypothetical protein